MNSKTSLTADNIRNRLGPDSFVTKILVFETLDSTNAYARNLVAGGLREPALVLAEEQTAGRGRRGRRWHSEKGKNLLFSLPVAPSIPRKQFGTLPLCLAVSVARAVQFVTGISLTTKWPNDLLVGSMKVCGILLETAQLNQDFVVIGIGLNVNQSSFPPDLNATSLSVVGEKAFDRLAILGAIMDELSWLSAPISPERLDAMLVDWRSQCTMFGKPVRVQTANGEIYGVVKNVAEDGGLVLLVDGKEQKVFAGDASQA